MENWIVVAEFYDNDVGVHLKSVLRANDIPYELVNPENHLNTGFGAATSNPFTIKVPEEKYELAQKLINGDEAGDKNIPIDDFTIEELEDIVFNPEDWHPEYLTKAKQLLEKKGVVISEFKYESNRQKKVAELELGKKPNLLIFYCMWFFALAGGLIGFISAWFYWVGKHDGFDGNRYYVYQKKYRVQGMFMLFTGLLMSILTFLYLYHWR